MEDAERLRAHLSATDPVVPHLVTHGSASAGRAVLVLPGFGDTTEVIDRRLDLIDPRGQWLVVVARPVADGPRGPMWYLVDDDGPDAAGVDRAVAAVDAALDAVAHRAGVPRTEVVLAGYSQGAATALATVLDPTTGPRPAALALLAGYLVDRPDTHLDPARAAGLRVLVAHGVDDDMVDPVRGAAAAKVLARHDASVTRVDVDGDHRLGPALLDPLRHWLHDTFWAINDTPEGVVDRPER